MSRPIPPKEVHAIAPCCFDSVLWMWAGPGVDLDEEEHLANGSPPDHIDSWVGHLEEDETLAITRWVEMGLDATVDLHRLDDLRTEPAELCRVRGLLLAAGGVDCRNSTAPDLFKAKRIRGWCEG